MRAAIGGGWTITHLTDRVVELRKEDVAYRRFTDRDGFVRVRIEPQMTRDQAVQKAIEVARQNDADLALRVAKQLAPSKAALARYTGQQVRLAPAFATKDQEPEQRRYRP